ncbi:MAG: hypothetical protein HY247_00985 [archaeon]|nr:MAG: hypothetical protein HY247_00985 [archaeon]
MERRWLAASLVAVAAVGVFFLAPVSYWYDWACGGLVAYGGCAAHPVYRSLGCMFLGYGDTYSPGIWDLRFGCNGPPSPFLE